MSKPERVSLSVVVRRLLLSVVVCGAGLVGACDDGKTTTPADATAADSAAPDADAAPATPGAADAASPADGVDGATPPRDGTADAGGEQGPGDGGEATPDAQVPAEPAPPLSATCIGSELASEQNLLPSDALCNADGSCYLSMQNGDLLFACDGQVVWRAGVTGAVRLRMQGDGNLVLRDADDAALWSSGTHGNDDASLIMENAGRTLVVRGTDGCSLWYAGATPLACGADTPGDACPVGQLDPGLLEAGPLVGHTTDASAQIWAYAPSASSLTVEFRPLGQCGTPATTVSMLDHGGDTSLAELTALQQGARYEYRLLVDGVAAAAGRFATAPTPSQAGRFSYMFGSCARVQRDSEQPVWTDVLAQAPAFQMIHGDTVYADTTDYDGIWSRHMQQRAVPTFANVIRQVPTYATWDDHDYGPNNSDGNEPGKENSLRAFTRLWANPGYGTVQTPGVFYSFGWADVQFFVMDNRYHRLDAEDYVGQAQLDWLKAGLASSSAVFKIIVHGGTIRRAGDESWFTRDAERQQLLGFIKDNAIGGVLFHGGDVHRNHFNPYPKCPGDSAPQYDVYELVSSGLSYESRFTMVDVDTVGTPRLTYRFFENGSIHESGTLTLQADGRMRHDLLEKAESTEECQEGGTTYAFPR